MEFPRKLDLTSRLYGAGLHAGRLTNSAPMTPWLKKDAKTSDAAGGTTAAGESAETHTKGAAPLAMSVSASTGTLPSLKNARQASSASLGLPGGSMSLSASASLGMLRSTSSLSTAGGTVALSAEAVKLLNLGRTGIGYVHERRRSRSGSGAAAAAAAAANAEGAPDGSHQTFIESLGLPPKTLEALTRGDFVYCLRRGGPDDLDTNAYELRVVNHKEISPTDYFTVSQAGVTHFLGADSDFTRLGQFERERRLFLAVRCIPHFARYRSWKMFTLWKNHIRRAKRTASAQHLTDSLFLLNPTLRTALMRLRRLCADAAEWGLFTCDRARTYSLEDFVALQNEKRVLVTTWLAEFSTDVTALVRSACDDVLDAFLAANSIHADHKMTFMERAALRTACRRLTKFVRLADFLVRDTLLGLALDSTQQLLSYLLPPPALLPPRTVRTDMPKAVAMGEDAPLGGHAAGGHSAPTGTAATGSAAAAGSAVAAARKTKGAAAVAPMFVVSVSMEAPGAAAAAASRSRGRRRSSIERRRSIGSAEGASDEPTLALTPSLSAVRAALKSVLYDAMVVISAPPRLLSHSDLLPYTRAASDDADDEDNGGGGGSGEADVDLTEVVTTHVAYKRMAAEMFAGLDAAFVAVEEFCAVYRPYAATFLANEGSVATLDARLTKASEVSDFESAITVYRGQAAEFDKVPTSADIGILRVNSVDFKRQLLPSPIKCLQALRELLPQLIGSLTHELISDVRAMHNVLSSSPTEVEAFVGKVAMLEKATEALPALRDRESHIRSLAAIMADNSWPLVDDIKAQFRMLREGLSDLDAATTRAEATLDEDTKKFARQVEQAIPTLKRNVIAVRERMDDPMISAADAAPARVVKYAREQAARMEELKATSVKFQHYQTMLKQPVQTFETLDEVAQDLQIKLRMWESLQDWAGLTQAWREGAFASIDVEEIGKQVANYLKVAVRSERMLPGNAAASKLRSAVEDFKGLMPVVQDLRNKCLSKRHWDEVEAVLGAAIDPAKALTLGELLDMNVVEHQAAISAITTKAVQEAALDELLAKKVTSVWQGLEFVVNSYKDSKDVFILGTVDDVVTALDESLVTINTVLGSRYCGHIRAEVEATQARLILLSETLDEWLTCQKQWMYLETIFGAEDIKRQLPEESKRFAGVDRSWKAIMKRTNGNPLALVAGTVKGLKETLVRHNEVLEQIQKSLEDYLETKRSAFPRFYFLSNDELLEILAQTRDPQAVQPHLRKCFDAIVKLEFGKEAGSVDILAMLSPESERIELTKNLKARGNVEDWLMEVQKSMISSLNRLLKEGVADYVRRPRKEWVLAHAGQVVATVAQIMWCKNTEEALREGRIEAVEAWYHENVAQLADLTALVRSDLSKLERKVIVALVTTDVHARDIVEDLKNAGTTSIGNFTWQQQLRYYWDDAKSDCYVRQSNSQIGYGYEYQGATTRLVITPLTDRCWLTITGAFHLKLGASPAGPAGTGKTESSKDLAKALAIQCIVFNCSDQIDYIMLGKLFSGLAQGGAWTCLDEFNRIDIEVLSVVAQQLQQLRQGIMQGLTDMLFEGRQIRLKPHCVIITMNPGYAGRTELPDNLKVQFRPVAMMVPDYALIAEIILFAEGFDDAKNLSRKMTKLYKLSSEQLSQQKHYDFGMRAVKSVLVMAGALKRSNPDMAEDAVLIRAMRDSNVPKFLTDDLPLFHAIVGDLFPGVTVPVNEMGELRHAIERQIAAAGLQRVEAHIGKIEQLFETFNVRFGVVIVGPTGSGKTAAYRTLAAAMTDLRTAGSKSELYQKVHINVLNPKCISMGELYGEFNELTQEWRDGLASTIIRSFVGDETEDRKWTTFDGPIDALWIENMNTVLDDNMMLCLANGERIKLKPSMRMLFEVGDLEEASPATVSRLGVVYMTPQDLGWKPIVQSFLPRELPADTPEPIREHIMSLFLATVDEGLAFRAAECSEPIPTTDVQAVTSLCRLFVALIREFGERPTGSDPAAKPAGLSMARPADELKRVLDSLFAFAYVWSIGGSIASDCYDRFDGFVRGHKASILGQIRYGPGSVFENFPDISNADAPWRRWSDVVPAFAYDREQPYFAMVVPTIDTVRFSYLLTAQLSQLHPVFFTGVTGTGKTVIVQDFLNRFSSPDLKPGAGLPVAPIVINFSARTSSMDTQTTIEAKLEKKKKTLLGAPAGKRVVLFVDDVNMPAVEEYGAQPPIELLRQLQDFHGVYDRTKLFWKDVADTVMVLAAAPPGGGRAAVTTRLTRHFHMLCVPVASDDVFKHIFGSIFSGFLAGVFPEEVRAGAAKVVGATVEVFNRIRDSMKPTPAKSHYTFNLRDVSKVFQGMLMIGPKECPNLETLLHLWLHESMRVFHDRLIDVTDKAWFTALAVELIARYFGKSGAGWTVDDLCGKKPVLFVDFLRPSLDDGDSAGTYEEAHVMAKVVAVLDDALEDYNLSNPTQMRLVFFRDAVEHVSRIARILRQPRGNAMLVGVGGSGKQSLTRIACHLGGTECFSIELTRGYGVPEFREDLKKIMLRSGVGGKHVAFLLADTQITQEAFLEDVSNLLNTGEVPGLFASDEVSKIIEDLRPVAQAAGVPDTRDNVYRLFISRVRDNLHIILTMSPVGNALRVRCRQFPSLINCCTIDWYTPWPEDALLSVATRFLADEASVPPELKAPLAEMCVDVHLSVATFGERFYAQLHRHVYTTPKSYLDLINLYSGMLSEKRGQLGELRDTLAFGSKKLDESNNVVASLRTDLTRMQPIIDQKSVEAAAMLIQVSADQQEAERIRVIVESDAADVAKQAAEVKVVQEDAQKDLDVALPMMQAAEESLKKLDKKDITEVRSFPKPPGAVRIVMEAVCLLLGEKTDWDTAKAVLGRSTFMEELLKFDSENVPAPRLKALTKYIENPDMSVETVSRVSKAATSLCQWVHAVDVFSKVVKEVEPKKRRLAELNEKLAAANATLKAKQDQLQSVLDKVAGLQRQCDEVQAEKARLAHEAQLTKDRLENAAKLTTGLADEGVRWKASVEAYDAQITALVGDVLLSAACVSYYGAFTGTYRAEMVASWLSSCRRRAIPVSEDFSLMRTLGDPVQTRDWVIAGLPTDSVSSDSAILVTRGKRWPLLIDPQEQAKKWIKNMEAKAKLAVTRLSNPNMLRTLESCIRIGQPLLIEDCGEFLDPALEPVLQRAVFKQGGRLLIHLGDSDVDYDPTFRLYLTTKMANPHYLPEVCIKVTIINFTVTTSGLEDQLLGSVVRKERPDVEKRKNDLVLSMAKDKLQLKNLEDRILRLLRESSGNILDDKVLIDTLAESKELSNVIAERLRESEKTEAEINTMRDRYRPVAIRGSILYFVVADLAQIDPMYQFSLAYFALLYNRCIDTAPKSDDLDTRLTTLIDVLTTSTFGNICRGLFEKDKLLFAFLMCVQILRQAGSIGDAEWLLLLRGAGLVTASAPNPLPDVLGAAQWNLAAALDAALPPLRGLCAHIGDVGNAGAWRTWATSDSPHTEPLPAPWAETLSPLQRMLVLKVFREEKLVFAVKEFVSASLGSAFVQAPPTAFADVFKDSREDTPIIFVLSVGADPTGMLFTYARSVNYTARLRLISLGQGQGPKAQALIEAAAISGDWVLLQNCHLARSWMPQLEKVVDSLAERVAGTGGGGSGAPVHPDFRLFLTSMPADYFPVPVLQNGVKLTNEPPRGVRANLQRSLAQIDSWTPFEACEGDFEDGMPKIYAWKKLAFGLCFFHAVVQERRKFGPLGFNVMYETNDSDLDTSLQILKMLLVEQPVITWDALRYITGQITYGGRVTDDWDRRCYNAILNQFYTPEILADGYAFSLSGVYHAPPVGDLESFRAYVGGLPLDDHPEVFGLHANASIAFQQRETGYLLETVLELQPRTGGGGAAGRSPDAIVGDLAAEISKALPAPLRQDEAGPTTFVMRGAHMDSQATVLSQEMARFNRLLSVMAASLTDLQRAIRGEVLLSAELDRMYTALLNNGVPANWAAVAYPSLKPLASWVKDLHARIDFMRGWLRGGQPAAFWLSGFFFPQGFMTGTLQNHARKYAIPIDTLSFSFRMLRAEDAGDVGPDDVPADGVLIYGLFMDGARWSREALVIDESRPGEIYSRWPVVHFNPTKDYKTPSGYYSAPIYKTSKRAGTLSTTGMSTNFIVAVDVPTAQDANVYVLKGAALLCQLND